MPKKQPLNNRINKEAMFKKIMPSATVRPKASANPSPSSTGGDELLDGLGDNLIDLTVSNFGDDLLDQLPSQPRVFATPAAPTAPVPPPSRTLPLDDESFEGYAIGDEEACRDAPQRPQQPLPAGYPPQPQGCPSPQMAAPPPGAAQNPSMPQPVFSEPMEMPLPQNIPEPQATPPPQSTQERPPAPEPVFPQPQAAPQASPPPFPQQNVAPQSYIPTQPQGSGYPAQPFPGYVPTQPYQAMQTPAGYPYPQMPSYPPPGYAAPPMPDPTPAASEAPRKNDGMPTIEQMPSATLLADSASVVTDTVIIQENNPGTGSAPSAPASEPAPPERRKPTVPEPFLDDEPPETPHPFQPEMTVEDTHLLDDYDALPPLSESNGEVVNVRERIVAAWLDDAIARLHCCGCEKCRMDVAAYALNRMAPQYVLNGELSEEMIASRRTVVETVDMLYRAVFQVKTFPRH